MNRRIPNGTYGGVEGGLITCLSDISIDNDLITEKQLVSREGVTELLKAQDQMQWVQRMNSIRDWATEIVNNDLIYA